MASIGKGEDFVDHRLDSNFNGFYAIFFEQGESFFIQGIGSGGDTDGIDQTRCEKGLNFFEIANLIIPMDGRETPPVKGNLFSPVIFLRGKSIERGFNKAMNKRGRGEPLARSLLIAEETTLTTTYGWKKNGYDQWNRAHITFNFRL
jgi:hypothetical protein